MSVKKNIRPNFRTVLHSDLRTSEDNLVSINKGDHHWSALHFT